MARNTRRSNGMKKIEPSVQTLWFGVSTSAQSTSINYIDLSQVASLVNRRFYRQGINWAVASIESFSSISTEGVEAQGSLTVSKLPTTWVMSNAWEKGFRAWQKMNNEALDETESIKPKFLDFKIYADVDHHSAGYSANLLPFALGGNFTAGEWEASKFVFPSSASTNAVTSVEVLGVGASYPGAGASGLDAVSLIEGYAASRALPEIADPNTPGDADDVGPTATPENWLGSLFTEGTEQDGTVLNDMQTENNIAPYPFENDGIHTDTMYPNGANQGTGLEVHEYGFITPTTVGNETNFNGGMFPCGLIRFDIRNDAVAPQGQSANMATVIGIRLVPGHHRGYLCEPMTEM